MSRPARWGYRILGFTTATAIVFCLVSLSGLLFEGSLSPKPAFFYFLVYVYACGGLGLINLLNAYRQATVDLDRLRLKYILSATAVMYTAGTTYFLAEYGAFPLWISNILVVISNAVIAYAVLKHELMDIRLAIKKTFLFTSLAVLTSIGYVLLVIVINAIFKGSINFDGVTLSRAVRINAHGVTSAICGLTAFGLAIAAALYARTMPQRLFVFFNLAVAAWGWGNAVAAMSADRSTIIFSWRAAYLGGFFISTFFYHLVIATFRLKRPLYLFVFYVHSVLLALLMAINPDWFVERTREAFGVQFNAVTPAMGAALAAFILITIKSYHELLCVIRQTTDEAVRLQARYFVFGFAFGFIGGITTLFSSLGLDIFYPAGNIGVAFYVCILAYAILKHRLLDIRVVVRKTLLYSIAASLLSVFYVLIIFVAQSVFLPRTPRAGAAGLSGTLYWVPSLVGLLVFLALSGFLFLNKPVTKEKKLLAFLCFQTFYWELIWFISFFSNDEAFLKYVAKSVYLTITLVPFTFYHLMVELTASDRDKKYVRMGYFLVAALIMLLYPTDWYVAGNQRFTWGNFSLPGPLYPLFVIAGLASMGRGLVLLARAYRSTKEGSDQRNKVKYQFLGFAFYALCTLDFLQVYGATWYPVGTFFFILSFITIAYAITRHHLLDISIFLRKTLFFSILTLLVSSVYLLAVLVFYSAFMSGKVTNSLLLNFLGVLFIALTIKPLEVIVHRFLERRFFKGSISEIAEQKERLESELERRERLKSVGILAAGMAHEIKNPITAINTFAEFLPAKYDDPEFREKFSRIVRQETARIKDIVTDLLLFSKPMEPSKKECRLGPMLQSVTDLLTSDMLKHSIRLQPDFTSDDEVCVDPGQMKQAFLNLIMNAIDAMKGAGGELRLATGRDGQKLVVTIEDTGKGIPPDKLPHIFDPFFTDKEHGTGLGLAITHSIIEKNAGRIEVESEVGRGTKFSIYLG